MNNKKLLSVIVNTYNSEKFLNQCLDSIIPKLNDKIELIIVDDSSIDNSKEIIDYKIKGISNVKSYVVNHNGVSSSRNYGIKMSEGEYIIFVDGDDYLTNNALTIIVNYLKSNKHDVTLFNIIKYIHTY